MNAVTETTILLVEDEPLWQQGIQSLLSLESDFKLIGIEDNYESALAVYESKKPDVVLLDWKLTGEKDGLDLGQALTEQGHSPQRLILVSGSDPGLFPSLPYPFVSKPKIASQLIPTIRKVSSSSPLE